jgi:hypothetical protein
MVKAGKRPSDAHRKKLADDVSVPTVSSFFPLLRYYEAATKVFAELQQTHQALQENAASASQKYDADFNTVLDLCYVYGRRYCHFCMDAIPQHNYYGTPQYKALENKHTLQVVQALLILEDVAEKMDRQEILLDQLREQQQHEQARLDQLKLEQWERDLQLQKQQSSAKLNGSNLDVEQSAMEKLKLLQPLKPPSSTRFQFPGDSGEPDTDSVPNLALSLKGIKPLLPPSPQLPPPPEQEEPTPPSYDAVVQKHRPLLRPFSRDPDGSEVRVEQPLPRQEITPKVLPMRQLQDHYKHVYLKCQQNGKITIQSIDTYQGRLSESTNGCTVISALVAAQHLKDPTPGTYITNDMIQKVIDQQCGPILRTIRRKLGLGGHALIIPSDVHDHLVDAKILHQEQFAGAAGGNIMDPLHYGEFLKLLSSQAEDGDQSKPSNGKAGATLFFREHVISIVKFTDPATKQVYFDLIDSMPGMLQNGKSMATRTRCRDTRSLELLLLWYASRKFSDANCSYIDRNPWDDSMADLDPRVFQGFVWST